MPHFVHAIFIICVSYAAIVMKMHCSAHPQHHGAAGRERKLTKTLFDHCDCGISTIVSAKCYRCVH